MIIFEKYLYSVSITNTSERLPSPLMCWIFREIVMPNSKATIL